jgi:prepilin-type N-terminal cleavage/methylation domain-containing protein
MKNFFLRNKKGVSLVEVITVTAIIGILSGISVPGYFYYKTNSELNLSVQQSANMIRKAKNNAVSVVEDDQWGVNIENNRVTVFKGSTFLGRDSNFDETVLIGGVTGVSGSNQIIFEKFTGLPSTATIITLSSGSQNKNIQINDAGTVSY